MTILTSVAKAALEATASPQAESLGFVRLTLTGIFGVTIGQALATSTLPWWLSAIISVLLMVALLMGSQLTAKKLGSMHVGRILTKWLRPSIDSINMLFTPISLPKEDEPEEFEQELIDSVEDFGETIVREIMVPRIDMATIDADVNLENAIVTFLNRGYSRLPVVRKNIDDISGVLYLKDVVRILHESPSKMSTVMASEIARPAIFIPESKPVDDLLREMQRSATHIAVIVDEYGGVAGLATMEDVIEEIVGEISDEYDRDLPDLEELADGTYRINASYSLAELGEHFELELEDEDVDSVGGLFAKELGRLPGRNDSVTVSGITISADRIEGRRKRLVTVIVQKDQALSDAQEAFDEIEKS
ncbi:MAG: hemolysin family protein [Rhodoluna sp.]